MIVMFDVLFFRYSDIVVLPPLVTLQRVAYIVYIYVCIYRL